MFETKYTDLAQETMSGPLCEGGVAPSAGHPVLLSFAAMGCRFRLLRVWMSLIVMGRLSGRSSIPVHRDPPVLGYIDDLCDLSAGSF
jgi:hypothetical protein